ncbi:MAG: hypothetical protein JWQ40_4540 [Segetibacter sp.]|nr:hypothetical protein [Segetibacter sp.]
MEVFINVRKFGLIKIRTKDSSLLKVFFYFNLITSKIIKEIILYIVLILHPNIKRRFFDFIIAGYLFSKKKLTVRNYF